MEISTVIKNEYPYPIASTYLKYLHIDKEDYVNRHDQLGDVFEITLKYLAVIILMDFRKNGKMPEYLSEFLKKILHPSLGHWNEIIRTISSEDTSKCRVAKEVVNMYNSKLPGEIKEKCNELQNILNSKITIKSMKECFDLFILYRNKAKGHGAKISKEEYKDRVYLIDSLLQYLLKQIEFIKKHLLFYVDEITVEPTKEFKHKIKQCVGCMIEPSSLIKNQPLTPNHLYLDTSDEQKGSEIDLHPLLSLFFSKDSKNDQVFIFNDYRKNRLEYLCYTTGHFHYPEMLSSEIEDFLKVSLSRIDSIDVGEFSENDIREKASEFFNEAQRKLAGKQYYEALEYLQYSNSLIDTWEANYYSAIILMLLSASPTEILFHLNTCQQIDPDNVLSNELISKLKNLLSTIDHIKNPTKTQKEIISKIAKGILEEEIYSPDIKPIYYYLTPNRLRDYYKLLWTAIPVTLLLGRIFIADMIEIEQNMLVQLLKIGMVLAFLYIVNYIIKSIPDIYFVFLQQIPDKSKDYFKNWFDESLKKIFGNFSEDTGVFKKEKFSNAHNRRYLLLFLILYPIAVTGAVFLTHYDNFYSLQSLFSIFDYIIMFFVIVIGVPIFTSTYIFIKDYSLFPLKPVVSKVNLLAVQKIGKIILIISLPWTFDYLAFTIIGFITFSNSIIFLQLSLFYFMVFLGCIWTLVTPYFFVVSLSKSKVRMISRYSEHIEKSFNKLIDNPNDENLEKYRWLIKQQSEFLNIKTNPLSLGTRISIYLLNFFIIVSALFYPFLKFNISTEDIQKWFNSMFIF